MILCVVNVPELELLEYQHSYQRVSRLVQFVQICQKKVNSLAIVFGVLNKIKGF